MTKVPISTQDHPLTPYLTDVAKTQPLSRAEEKHLATLARSGDVEARNKLVSANLRFVISVALQFQNQGLPLDDLIAHGNIGLLRAAEKFDPDLGNKFITYGVWWIRQAIQQALAKDTRSIKIPMNRVVLLNQARSLMSSEYQSNERRPSLSDAAEELDVDEAFLSETLQMSARSLSLDAETDSGEGGQSLLEVIPGSSGDEIVDGLEQGRLETEIDELLKMLPEREEHVIRNYFGLNESETTLDGIGQQLGVSRERARQIKEAAINKLRRFSGRTHLQQRFREMA